MAVAMTDTSYLSGYLSVPEHTISAILTTPTIDLVQVILQAIATKAYEHEECKTDKLRLEIELESAVRGSESRAQGLKSSVEKALKEVDELRTNLNATESMRTALENELSQIKSSSTSSSTEVDSLKLRISTLEASNRDTIAVLENKKASNDVLAQDLQKQHQRGVELGQQISSLQQQLQNADSLASQAKFRQQSLSQELEQAKRNNDWLETELKTKSEEAIKFRKEKGARIAELVRANEDATSTIDVLKKSESALRIRLEEVQVKVDETLTKVQQLQEAAARAEDGFRQSLESSRRLAELREQQAETHKNRLAEVEATLEEHKDDTSAQLEQAQQMIEAEQQERDKCENRIIELEADVERLEGMIVTAQHAESTPATPRAGINGLGRPSSPFSTPFRGRSAVTATQAIDELYKVKAQLSAEKRRADKLELEMEEMMQGLEAKQPEIEELQAEHARLQAEVVEMSKYVDKAGQEAERAKKDAKRATNEASTAQAEAQILTQQLRDLSIQVKFVLFDLDARERGLENLSELERQRLELLSRGQDSADSFTNLTDSDILISERLTVFRSISELQDQNQELLRITRELGAKMESEEALAAKHQAAKDHQDVQVLLKRVEDYKDELDRTIVRTESYIKERDMFRRMLQHRGDMPVGLDAGSMFDHSVIGNGMMNSTNANRDDTSILALRELQRHFDEYREEHAIDRKTLKEQADRLATEKSTLQSEVARVASQLTLANERLEMLQSNFRALQSENSELKKRSSELSENAAKQDLRSQKVAEDLIEAYGLVKGMLNEIANLKAEKELWKGIQERLNQDNENLLSERNRLNANIANQQTMQNERELSENEARRRLQKHVDALETELSTTKRKLNDEIEDNKRAQQRKEYDTQQHQIRVDDLNNKLGMLREELAEVKSSRGYLHARVDELTIELKSAEERVGLLQPRPTPRPGTAAALENEAGVLSRERELSVQISELSRDLELARGELDAAATQMEQYKTISRDAEEELRTFNDTHEQYRQEMDHIIEEKDGKIRELQQRVEDLSAELTSTNEQLNKIRDEQTEVNRRISDEKLQLDAENTRLQEQVEQHSITAREYKQDLRTQADIATKAQQDYEQELVKHAAAAQMLQGLRIEYNALKSTTVTIKTEAESAKVALSQGQISWTEQREQFERELADLRSRKTDIDEQNKLLLQQLEDVTNQVTTLQKNRAARTEIVSEASAESGPVDKTIEGLRELVTYLRRDKEIVDVQYELSLQEGKRLRQQLEYAQSQLDEARLKLDQERRSQADTSRSSMAHDELMEKLNSLNLLRESNTTLRNEAAQTQSRLEAKTRKVEELVMAIQPLETKVRELENGKEMQDGEIRLLQEDRDRWQKRNQEILSKYDRIDPAEMEQLKQSVTTLQTEKDDLLAKQTLVEPLQARLTEFEAKEVQWQETRKKIIEQAKERNRANTAEKTAAVTARDAAVKEKEQFEEQLITVRVELEQTIKEKQAVETQIIALQQELAAVKESQVNGDTTVTANHDDSANAAVDAEMQAQLTTLQQELSVARAAKTEVNEQLIIVRQELEAARVEKELAAQQAGEEAAAQASQVVDAVMTESGEEGEVSETTVTNPAQPNAPAGTISDADRKSLEERVAIAEARAKEIESTIESSLRARSDKMKAALNAKLKESKDLARAQLDSEYQQKLEAEKVKLEQEKRTWLAEKESAERPASTKTEDGAAASANTSASVTDDNPPEAPATASATPVSILNNPAPSDMEVKAFISSNEIVKSILAANIRKKIDEAQKKAEESKAQAIQQAISMESKKSSVKLSMAENKARLTLFKLNVVEKAAHDTPEKPVKEVWDVAKGAKPESVPTAASGTQSAIPTPGSAPTASAQRANGVVGSPSTVPANSPPTGPASIASQQQTRPATPQGSQASTSAPTGPANSSASGAAAGPAARTGIPVPRGGGIPRGRGGSQIPYSAPRGGGASIRGRGGAQGSGRGGGNMNPGAASFSPGTGSKRPGDDSVQSGGQKRIRGGGGGGGAGSASDGGRGGGEAGS